jgi:hypothetical protein
MTDFLEESLEPGKNMIATRAGQSIRKQKMLKANPNIKVAPAEKMAPLQKQKAAEQ